MAYREGAPLTGSQTAPLEVRLQRLREPSARIDPQLFRFSDKFMRDLAAQSKPHTLVHEAVYRLGLDFDEPLTSYFEDAVRTYETKEGEHQLVPPDIEYFGTLLGQAVTTLNEEIDGHYGTMYAHLGQRAQQFGSLFLSQTISTTGLQEAS